MVCIVTLTAVALATVSAFSRTTTSKTCGPERSRNGLFPPIPIGGQHFRGKTNERGRRLALGTDSDLAPAMYNFSGDRHNVVRSPAIAPLYKCEHQDQGQVQDKDDNDGTNKTPPPSKTESNGSSPSDRDSVTRKQQ
ncbi:predicted protein [Phaeodactylum tricornutum CCAP 1055/1]|uniref:Secreted protein n=3 Tax=Phaeodactylum tricornutum TaxID=2850 RepID=B7GEM4_PHATC|nr:predicted protein [Phaeodactylum tricornutum CCAP 1055/1]EEC42938.1 predicted protein [Phaeodactylum tricornutum CCAP 1055/1]|eukprot:XP_002185573.1 predicted protein [Phaeodactylum tricornutum CCAP 1055/1]